MSELAATSLVAENAFPNAGSTTASTTSALTGKQPIINKVYRYPDILSGRNSFEHLPGILRQHGYKTVEIGTPYYVDAQRLNMLEGFDIVNSHSMDLPASEALRVLLGNTPSNYFIQTISEKSGERLLHIFHIKDIQTARRGAHNPCYSHIRRAAWQIQIIDLLDHADQPVLIFAHLIDTHGPKFAFQKQIFSGGSSADQNWDQRRYLDEILSFR